MAEEFIQELQMWQRRMRCCSGACLLCLMLGMIAVVQLLWCVEHMQQMVAEENALLRRCVFALCWLGLLLEVLQLMFSVICADGGRGERAAAQVRSCSV
jgi:hypothetical protein